MLSKFKREDIVRIVEEENIRFIRLEFTDIFGIIKSVAITACQIEKALDNKCMFDGSSIEGFVRIEESDMYLRPDIDSFAILPWGQSNGKTARLICDVYNSNGTPFEGDPRYVLRKALEKANKMGYDNFNVGPECEFFLFHTDSDGNPTTTTHDDAGYFDMGPVDLGSDARKDMCLALEEMGFEIEASHHEVAPGQHEIDFKYVDAISSADAILTFKLIVKSIAQRHGLHATFMPKPIMGINGSGMHTNVSLFKDGKNAFYEPNGKKELSQDAYYFIGGLIKHMKGITAITNPLVNSYKRLVPGYEAPVYIAWSARNRSPLIRIPAPRGASTRLEMRSPDPTCNPYLALSVILMAGLDGIENKIDPPKSVNLNIYELSEAQREQLGIDSIPASLGEAIEAMETSELVKSALGNHIFTKYLEAKKGEWKDYQRQVSDWEISNYLQKY